ncbi:MAG: hypothetical protein O3A00_27845, partial [Planctomycetota bacterium]|nr:hypothetical protein [Planctomycetota bacterium]
MNGTSNLPDQEAKRRCDGTSMIDREISTVGTPLGGSNNLVIADSNNSVDNLVIKSDGSNSRFVISDAENTITTAIAGATGSGTNQVTIPFSGVSGAEIQINTLGSGDAVTVDYSLGNFAKSI